MQIANPIYDVVFKYLMEDGKVAKLLISSIIGQDVELLEFSPKEFTSDIITEKRIRLKDVKNQHEMHFFTVYRLDFLARIKSEGVEKNCNYRNTKIQISR